MAASVYRDAAIAAADKYGVPREMFLFQIGQESSWNPNAKNPKPGSTSGGLGGFIDSTAKEYGIDKFDPLQALDAAAKYDAKLFKQTGNWQTALERYGTLAGASPEVYGRFNAAMAADMANGDVESPDGGGSLISKMANGAKSAWNNSMFGLAGDTVANLTGGVGSAGWDFRKYFTMGAFVLLAIIIIAIAVMQNQTVRKAVTKGVA